MTTLVAGVSEAVRGIEAALCARHLYDPGHPAITRPQGEAVDRLARLMKSPDQARITVVLLENRVVCGEARLPGGRELAPALFASLERLGIEHLTFEKGLSASDLARLLDALAKGEGETPRNVPHVRFGAIDLTEAAAIDEASLGMIGVPMILPRQQAAAIQEIWRGIYGEGCSIDVLGSVVADICATAAIDGGSMLPLASLKRHDEYTFIHTINVAILSAALAEAVGLGPDTVHDLTIAALLHDVGKRGVPKRVLNKEAQLSDSERRVMQRHPMDGARLLFETPDIPEMARIVAFEHHMHLDGSGYPDGGSGWTPHLGSRIVQIADVFDALRTHRPYRRAMSLEKSLSILTEGAGTCYDPDLLKVFVDRVVHRTDRERAEGDERMSA